MNFPTRLLVPVVMILVCRPAVYSEPTDPFQATGIKVGEVTDTTAIVWTRLTLRPERNPSDRPMVKIIQEKKDKAKKKAKQDKAKKAPKVVTGVEYPEGVTVKDIRDAVPGADGEARVLYRPAGAWGWFRTDWKRVDPQRDFTRQFTLTGLEPDTRYEVHVEARGGRDHKAGPGCDGRFRTAPSPDNAARVVFTVSTGQAYKDHDVPDGYKIYRAMLELDPSFFVHTGDIVYYDKLAKTEELARYHWQRTYSLPTNVEFHRQVASYFIKDDHDTWMNDSWPAQKSRKMFQFTWAQGVAIFREQVPMGERTYRTRRWGKDLQVWMVEGRDFRSPNNAPDGPEKTIWGREQKEWFKRTVAESDATFRVLISPTPIVGPDREKKRDNHSNANFTHEGDELRRFLASQKNMFVICGDRHWQYMSVHPETGVREYSCGPASDGHAGGWKQDDYRAGTHRYLNVIGGFLSATVERGGEGPTLTLRYHDSEGRVQFEDVRHADGRPRAASVVVGNLTPEEGGVANAKPSPLKSPFGLDFDAVGNMLIVELEGGRVHRRDAEGKFETIGGDGSRGYAGDGGVPAGATFNGMHNVAVTPPGDVFIADSWNHVIRKIDRRTGRITTFAGTGEAGFGGDGGAASEARFNYIMCISLNPSNDRIYVADLRNRRIRVVDLETELVSTVAGNGQKGVPENGDVAVDSPLVDPRAVAVDSKENVYILERGGQALRVVGPDGEIRTVVGKAGKAGYRDGPALAAQLKSPKHICIDSEDCVVIADDQNRLIRRYDPRTETVTTILGGESVPRIRLSKPHGVCFDRGRLFVVDTGNDRILRVHVR